MNHHDPIAIQYEEKRSALAPDEVLIRMQVGQGEEVKVISVRSLDHRAFLVKARAEMFSGLMGLIFPDSFEPLTTQEALDANSLKVRVSLRTGVPLPAAKPAAPTVILPPGSIQ